MWDDSYTKGSMQRYRMFLLLLARHPTVFLTPTYDIDLVWHAHQVRGDGGRLPLEAIVRQSDGDEGNEARDVELPILSPHHLQSDVDLVWHARQGRVSER